MKNNHSTLALLLTAAGSSTRIGSGTKKEYVNLNGGTVLSCSAKTFLQTLPISYIVITHPKDRLSETKEALEQDKEFTALLQNSSTQLLYTEGGNTRQQSVFNGLNTLKNNVPETKNLTVLIHDGARPFATPQLIQEAVDAAIKYKASVPAIDCVDTVKEKNIETNTINRHLVRKTLCCVQTPQCFLFDPIYECHKKAQELNKEFTDDTEIWDAFPELTGNTKVYVTKGNEQNKKITYLQDLNFSKETNKMIKVGLGTDLHELVEGRDFYLGGIKLPSPKGEKAHSDGDVLLHAITDSLLGAAGIGDIGSYFPDTDPQWKDASSVMLIKKCWQDVKALGFKLENLDCVVETELPKILPYRQEIISSIAKILDVNEDCVFVKAKTNEKKDSIGKGEAIKAYCVCLLSKY